MKLESAKIALSASQVADIKLSQLVEKSSFFFSCILMRVFFYVFFRTLDDEDEAKVFIILRLVLTV